MLLQRGCTWLTLMPLLLSLSIGELSFYRNALPETPEDIAIKQLARYLEAQHLQHLQQRLHRSHLPTFLSPMQFKEHNTLQQAQQKVLEALTDKTVLENLLTKQKEKLLMHHHRPNQYHDAMVNKIAERESGYFPYHYNVGGIRHPSYSEEVQSNEGVDRFSKDFGYRPSFEMDDDGSIAEEEPIEDSYHAKYDNYNHATGAFGHHESGKEAAMKAAIVPDFVYKFDNSNLNEKHPFAVKPNDPRYYSDLPFSSDVPMKANWKEEKTADEERMLITREEDMRSLNQKIPKDLTNKLEPERSSAIEAGLRPLILPVHRDMDNDVYFIAIVAGCSAAAMFALVLVTLTWCRLLRGAKAAADIEYPAYGVTGPNKDVSPSGDQRLAQSAQMYHFQHQKQQIIAMENRTSATRDPGSLSEAESDEENEEGDYTVYECPGLASTGEMEVKNPMFHDDPTPATPATQGNNKEEDHI
ncbi:uncharacterized protein LOC109858294 isoform X2 [Pseudomyrmex gracilis]|uniref:uncharacterized protein LOC109858294 isoform X2 n=1 Tax=Pseudomyrmex gracilis TaxID=219809 RepID=UPI000994E804|nr:uncharacterized protein LOC109858294 isoform X2 [Pseudomyrmex gracilis]